MKKIDNYFKKCVVDAYTCEKRPYDQSLVSYFYVIIGDKILFKVETPYTRVTKLITGRLERTLPKYFGLKTKDTGYWIDDTLQTNHACNKIVSRGKEFYICDSNAEVRYNHLLSAFHDKPIDEIMEANMFSAMYTLPPMKWNEYRELYKKAYGKYPNIEITDRSFNVKEIN